MLNIYLGENEREKLRICAKKMTELTAAGKEVIAIVPDQYSFAFDKALYGELGAKSFNEISTVSFKKFSENLIERYGTRSGTLVSQNDRMILLYIALKRVRAAKSLKILDRAAEKTAFCDDMSRLIDTMRRGGITPEQLKSASERVGGTLGDKLSDVSEIFSAYSAVMAERGCRDESSVITEGGLIAAETGTFRSASVFVFRFDSFSPDELSILKCAVKDAESVTVSLSMPREYRRSAVSPFIHIVNTQNALLEICSETNTRPVYSYCDEKKTGNRVLSGIGSCLFTPAERKIQNDGSISVVRADSIYDEAEYVAATIRRLYVEEGYSFNDIAVLTHDITSYADALEAAFERYGVEAFTDRPQPASGMSLALFALDAVEAASTRQPDTDRILKYLRSPFSPLTQDETSALWDYSVRWNVDGKMWESDFTAFEKEDIASINAAREKAVGPLKRLHDASKSATAKEIASAFCEFLKETDAAGRAFSVIEECTDPDLRLETARLFKQLWTAVMSAVTSVYLIAGDEKMTLRSFGELLRLMLSQTSVSTPPQKLDSVTLADVSRSVIGEPKAVFVVGLADGVFPADIKKSGLFSGRDIAALEEIGVRLDVTPEGMLCSERYDCYKALTAASQRLYLSWSGADLRGRELRPSRFIRRIRDYCGEPPKSASSLGAELYCSTPRSAYYHYAVSRRFTPAEKSSVREALLSDDEYREKLMKPFGSGGVHRLSPDVSKRLFAPKDINITASRIDVYNRCNFEYFCRYGLNIKPVKPLDIDPSNRGSVLHYIFENVLGRFGDGFSEASDGDISEMIDGLLNDYFETVFGGDFGKSAKFMADYHRLGTAAFEILLNMRDEFRVSKFRPVKFEYDLSREGGGDVLKIPIGRGVSVIIRGIVDRVDCYTAPDGKHYIRVIDYKTGEKSFCYEDIYNGINLQMLLYMLALTEGNDVNFKNAIPGGILYMRAGFLSCEDDFDPLSDGAEERLKRSAKQFKRSGLVVDIDESVAAMDSGFSGKFVPASKNKDGSYSKISSVISPESFARLEDFAKRKAERFGADLLSGKIDAVPLGENPDSLRCRYCDYTSVCDRRKYMMRLISKTDADALKHEIGISEAE